MLCSLIEEPFDDPDWIFEPKLDGVRVLAEYDGRALRLWSRNGKLQNAYFPEVVSALKSGLKQPAILDGEIVCLDEHGNSSFRLLQQRFHIEDPKEVRSRAAKYPAQYFLFDILRVGREDLTERPLFERKRVLSQAVKWNDRIREVPYTPSIGHQLFSQACQAHAEGIVGKDLRSAYHGGRTGEWVKIKCLGRQELVIGGYTDPQGSRVGLGALLVGYYEPGTKGLVYAGKVGTGFDLEMLLDLSKRLSRLHSRSSPFAGGAAAGAGTHWVKPRLVAEFAFAEWTQNGLLRQPRFVGLRDDKDPQDIRKEVPRGTRRVQAQAKLRKNPRARSAATPPGKDAKADLRRPGASRKPSPL